MSWRCTRKEAGFGALADLGSHVLSVGQYPIGEIGSTVAQAQTCFPTRSETSAGMGYGAKAGAHAPRREVENEDQIQTRIRFSGDADGSIEASRVSAGKVLGIFLEVAGTKGTIVMYDVRFSDLQVARFADPNADPGVKTLLAGSQVPHFDGVFGFDFGRGALGFFFDVNAIEVHDLIKGLCGDG